MELATDTPPKVLKIASMFASLSAQNHRAAFAKGNGRMSVESETVRTTTTNAAGSSTTKTVNIVYAERTTTNSGNSNIRTRSRSSDSRPACLDLKVIDNKAKFDHVKALFENLERQSRLEQRHRTPHNSKKRVASPSPTRSTTVRSEPVTVLESKTGGPVVAGPPAFRTVTINKRDHSSRPVPADPKPVANNETSNFSAVNNSGRVSSMSSPTTRIIPIVTPTAPSPVTSPPPPPVPPKPRLPDSPTLGNTKKPIFQRQWTLDSVPVGRRNGSERSSPPSLSDEVRGGDSIDTTDSVSGETAVDPTQDHISKGGPTYYSRIIHPRSGDQPPSNDDGKASLNVDCKLMNAVHANVAEKPVPNLATITTNTTSSVDPKSDNNASAKQSVYEPYWRSNRFPRQRLANGESSDSSTSPQLGSTSSTDSASRQVYPKRNFLLKSGGVDGASTTPSLDTNATLVQSKNDPGRLDIVWPPQNAKSMVKSPTDENKDSGIGSDSPSTSTTDSRTSQQAILPQAPLTDDTFKSFTAPVTDSDDQQNVALMTKEEASVLLSPSTRDVVLRETRGRSKEDGEDGGEVRSLPSHLSIPQDVDLKRLSMCSMDSSSEQGGGGGSATDRYSVSDDANVNMLPDGHFWMEVPGLVDEPPPSPTDTVQYKKATKVKFSNAPIKVYSTYTGIEYDRRNDDVDPVSASAEYELERRLEKMDILEIELQKGPEGLGFSIIGMGVGADAGLEKLGIFVKSITPGGAVHKDGRICICDQIVEVDGNSLVGVSQNYAASVLRSTSGTVRFKIGREKDLDSSEIAALIRHSLEQDRLVREQEDLFQRRFNGVGDDGSLEMRENTTEPSYQPQYNHYLAPPNDLGHHQQHRSHESPLPSTDSVFTHDEEDQTPEQLVDSNPHIDRLMSQLREPFDTIHEKRTEEECDDAKQHQSKEDTIDNESVQPVTTAAAIATATATAIATTTTTTTTTDSGSPAFRNDFQSCKPDDEIHSTYTAAEAISRLLNDSMNGDEAATVYPPNSSQMETVHDETDAPPWSLQHSGNYPLPGFGQLRRTTPDLTSSIDSMNGSEIQLRINNLESELSQVRNETDQYQSLLNESKTQYDNLEKKYSRAKKLIKDYQDREKDLIDREEAHLRQLREKDEQYANLVKMLKEKVVGLEKQLQDAHRKRASIVESIASVSTPGQSSATDISPALAYQPAKKMDQLECSLHESKTVPTPGNVRIVPIVREPSLASDMDGTRITRTKQHGQDFGVPPTELLDSTAAKSKAEAVKQSQVMSARALPTRRHETEVFIMCHHTLEHAQMLRDGTSGGQCGAALCSNTAHGDSPTIGPVASSPGGSSKSTGSPSTPRRLTARAALLLRKKASLNSGGGAGTPNRRIELNSSCSVAVGGGDLEKVPAVLTWTCDDVCRFLKSIGLDKYTPEFSINRIDGCKLLQLDGSRLKAMGVQNHSDRSLVKKQIKEMKTKIERERKQLEKESRRLLKLEKERRHHSSK